MNAESVAPLYLVLLAFSPIAEDGAALGLVEGIKGKVNAALGPLLIVAGFALAGATIAYASDAESPGLTPSFSRARVG